MQEEQPLLQSVMIITTLPSALALRILDLQWWQWHSSAPLRRQGAVLDGRSSHVPWRCRMRWWWCMSCWATSWCDHWVHGEIWVVLILHTQWSLPFPCLFSFLIGLSPYYYNTYICVLFQNDATIRPTFPDSRFEYWKFYLFIWNSKRDWSKVKKLGIAIYDDCKIQF